MSALPGVPVEGLAERFRVMMRRAGWTRTLLPSGEILLETDGETPEAVALSIQNCAAILGVTTSVVTEAPNCYRVTLLRLP